ncbi:molybdate ABC transporter substrate-binding protein [Anoxybacteroides tepidamans]|uniref:molybdate ABC transporter substrate-binding protein n=1 Tax=Anoxybacteroides tepidamans TaxID=265948 RepID=UPI00048837F4|nr:molybdate ABC transporter substrate-binding protein [Anoxybacillus tepidamans]
MRKAMLLFLVCFAAIAGGCNQKETKELKIAAAADLTLAFKEIGKQFEQKTGTHVVFSFGSTGQLEEQIKNGAPFDVFAAANVKAIDELKNEHLIIPGTDYVYALGKIGIVTKDQSVRKLDDLLQPDVKRIAIANPSHAPYGLAAKQALEKGGIWNKIKNKLVYGKNIADTLAYVESGNAEAGIVAYSLVKTHNIPVVLIDERMYEPIQQEVAVLKATKYEKEAKQFVEFLHSRAGQQIMKKYGFTIPKEK